MSRPPRVVSAAPRLAAKASAERRRRRHTRLRRTAWLLAGLAPVALVGWLLMASSVFSVRDVVVSGQARLSVAQILTAADVADGTPLARVDTGAVAARVRTLAPVASVTVTRNWPHKLTLTVVERRPVVAVPRGASFLLVDAHGAPIVSVRHLPRGLPLLAVTTPAPGDASTRAALAVLRALPTNIRGRLGGLSAVSPEQVQLTLRDGRKIIWGGVEDTPAKAAAVLALMRMPGTVFDVSAPGVVTRR